MSDLGFLPRMIAIKLAHFNVYGDDIPVHLVEGYVKEIITNFNANNSEKQKHEEIKSMAWELYKQALLGLTVKAVDKLDVVMGNNWALAEKFYNFAKEKEEEKKDA